MPTNKTKARHSKIAPPTIRDVARVAGVSVATVSRVFNHPKLVGPDVLRRVQAAIHELDYIPNGAARALTSKVTRTVGAVMPTIDGGIYAKMIGTMQRTFEEHGRVLFVAAHEYSLARELENVKALVERGVDAVILVGAEHDPMVYEVIGRSQIPLVQMCTYKPDSAWPSVGWDNRLGGQKVAGYVADAGHRQIAIIAGILKDNDRAAERMEGFLEALSERGIAVDSEYIVECRYDLAESASALKYLMSRTPVPTAILCGNDILAIGALLECTRSGIKVPEDVSITGYDDLELAGHLLPPLTTVRIPAEQTGRVVAETVVGMISGATRSTHVRVDIDLIVRGTTAQRTQQAGNPKKA